MSVGAMARSSGNHQDAINAYQEAIDLYSALNLQYRVGVAYYNLGRTYYAAYEDSLMLVADSVALMVFQEIDSTAQEAQTLNQLGNHMSSIGLNRESITAYQAAIELSYTMGDTLRVGLVKNNLGLVLKDLGEYQNALAHLYESLDIKEHFEQSDRSISSALLNIGLVLDLLDKPREALIYYGRSAIRKQIAGDSLGIARVYSNMAVIHKNLEQYDSAIHYIESSNSILAERDDDNLKYVNHTNLGNLYKRTGKIAEAGKTLQLALNFAERMKDINKIGDTYQNLGSLAFDTGNPKDCVKYNLKALDYTNETQSYAQIMEIHLNLQEAYAKLGDFNLAHVSAVQALRFRDSVYRIEQIKASEELQTKYETEKKEQRIDFQQTQLAQQSSIILRNRIIMAGLGVLTVFGIILIWLWRQRQKRQLSLKEKEYQLKLRDAEMNAIIQSQEKERKRFATDLHDGFGQLISVLKLNLGRLNKNNAKDIDLRQAVFDQSGHVINDMYAELRNICFDLMPQTLVKRGLPAAINEFGDRINNSSNMLVEVIIFGVEERFTELMEISLYRIMQEWVNNVLKYSNADLITIQLIEDEEDLTLTIEDNGPGFNPNTFYEGKGNGWRNIRSRLNLISGDFLLDSREGTRGSMVTISIAKVSQSIPTGTEMEITA